MVQMVEHAVVAVSDLDAALDFYTECMGLVELDREDGTVYLGCGLDDHFDLGLRAGGSGVDHFAVRTTETDFDRHEADLRDAGVDVERTDGEEPGQERGLRFALPSGVEMEFVTLHNDRYPHVSDTAHVERSAVAPSDFEHINLASHDPRADVEFLQEHAGFELTEVQRDPDADRWELVFSRYDDCHHDVAFTYSPHPGDTLHHVAFVFPSFDQMKAHIDELVRHDVALESGVSRHRAGNNLFAYFWSPGGNRVELCTEMATLPPDTGTVYRDETFTFSSWGGITPPDSFSDCT